MIFNDWLIPRKVGPRSFPIVFPVSRLHAVQYLPDSFGWTNTFSSVGVRPTGIRTLFIEAEPQQESQQDPKSFLNPAQTM